MRTMTVGKRPVVDQQSNEDVNRRARYRRQANEKPWLHHWKIISVFSLYLKYVQDVSLQETDYTEDYAYLYIHMYMS